MKRDPDLVRAILLEVERKSAREKYADVYAALRGPYTEVDILYHIRLLAEAKYIKTDGGINQPYPLDLTWAGHELLDATRNDTLWNEAKRRLEQAGGFTLELLAKIASQLLLEAARKNLS